MGKVYIGLLRGLALVAGLVAGGSALAQTATLTFWSWRTEDVDAYSKFIGESEKVNPGIKVRFIPYKNTEYNTILSTALQGGAGPDIIHLRAYGGMEPFANAGYLMSLDDKVPALKNFNPNILKAAANRADGKVYGIPFALQTIQVLYNKRIFSELGLQEPQTWADFIAVAKALQAKGYYALANGAKDPWTLETLFGGVAPSYYGCTEFYNQVVAGKTNFLDPQFKKSIQKVLELRPYLAENYMGVGYTDMQTLFAYERAGMFIGGSYELGTMAQLNPKLRIGVFPVPAEKAGDPNCMTFYVDGSYGINAKTKYPKEALAFINFLATRQYGQMFTDTLKQISAVPGIRPSDATLREIVQLMNERGTPYLMLTAFRYGQPSGSTLLQNELQAVFVGKQNLDQALENIQKGVASWYKPFQK